MPSSSAEVSSRWFGLCTCAELIGMAIIQTLVTGRDAEHRREKMSELLRKAKYKLNEKKKRKGWQSGMTRKANLKYLGTNGRRQCKGALGKGN